MLDEPVRELLPAGTVRKPGAREITLLDLATQRSGLPRMPDNFRGRAKPYLAADLYRYIKKHGVAKLVIVQAIQAGQAIIAEILGCHSGDGEVTEGLAGNPGERRRDVDEPFVDRFVVRAVETHARGIQHARREHMVVIQRDVLIARVLFRVRSGRFDGWRPVDIAVVQRVAHEERVFIRKTMVDTALSEILVGGLRRSE